MFGRFGGKHRGFGKEVKGSNPSSNLTTWQGQEAEKNYKR